MGKLPVGRIGTKRTDELTADGHPVVVSQRTKSSLSQSTKSSPSVATSRDGPPVVVSQSTKSSLSQSTKSSPSVATSRAGPPVVVPQSSKSSLSGSSGGLRGDITRRDVLRHVLARRAEDARGCMTLPWAIAFFVLYAFAMRLHEDITNVFLLESAVRREVGRHVDEVHNIETMWQWLQGPFVDVFFVQEDLYGDPLPRSDWSRVLMYTQVQGSILLQQHRGSRRPWGVSLAAEDAYAAALQEANEGFRPLDPGAKEAKGAGRRLSLLRPELDGYLLPGRAAGATYDFAFYPTMNRSEIRQRLTYLEQRGWLDKATDRVEVTLLLLNSELGRPRLEHFVIEFQFSRGGGVYHRVKPESLFLRPFPSYLCLLADGVWVIMLLLNTAWLLRRAWRATESQEDLLAHVTNFAVLLEWVIVIFGWVNVALFWYVYWPLMSNVQHQLDSYRSIEAETHEDLRQAASRLHTGAADMVYIVHWFYRNAMAWYNLVLMLRFFLAFRAQPRLAVVMDALQVASVDLLHFIIVFFPTFIAYVISGNLLFGRRLPEFSTLQASAGTCFRIAIENEFEWEVLSEEHFWTTALWVWTFLVLVVLIMLNMVLAIILDVYNEVRSRAGATDSIFQFVVQLFRKLRHIGAWVEDSDLDKLLSEMDGATTITQEDLGEMLPRMTQVQQDMIFDACRNHTAWKLKQEMHRGTFMNISAAIKSNVNNVHERLTMLLEQREKREKEAKGETSEDRPAASRMFGTSRPFPGLPAVPGGYAPPLLSPPLAAAATGQPPVASFESEGTTAEEEEQQKGSELEEAPQEENRPEWLAAVDAALDAQQQQVSHIQEILSEMQQAWIRTQRLAPSKAGRLEPRRMSGHSLTSANSLQSALSRVPTTRAGGVPIL